MMSAVRLYAAAVTKTSTGIYFKQINRNLIVLKDKDTLINRLKERNERLISAQGRRLSYFFLTNAWSLKRSIKRKERNPFVEETMTGVSFRWIIFL